MTPEQALAAYDAPRQRDVRTAMACFDAICRVDIPGILTAVHDDLRFEIPFGDPPSTRNREEFRALFELVAERFDRFELHLVDVAFDAVDPDLATLKYQGDCTTRIGSIPYRNR